MLKNNRSSFAKSLSLYKTVSTVCVVRNQQDLWKITVTLTLTLTLTLNPNPNPNPNP